MEEKKEKKINKKYLIICIVVFAISILMLLLSIYVSSKKEESFSKRFTQYDVLWDEKLSNYNVYKPFLEETLNFNATVEIREFASSIYYMFYMTLDLEKSALRNYFNKCDYLYARFYNSLVIRDISFTASGFGNGCIYNLDNGKTLVGFDRHNGFFNESYKITRYDMCDKIGIGFYYDLSGGSLESGLEAFKDSVEILIPKKASEYIPSEDTKMSILSFIPSILGAIGGFVITVGSFEVFGISLLSIFAIMALVGAVILFFKIFF